MTTLEGRIRALEEQQPSICMVAMRFLGEHSYNWNGRDFPDLESLNEAAAELQGPLIIINFRRQREHQK